MREYLEDLDAEGGSDALQDEMEEVVVEEEVCEAPAQEDLEIGPDYDAALCAPLAGSAAWKLRGTASAPPASQLPLTAGGFFGFHLGLASDEQLRQKVRELAKDFELHTHPSFYAAWASSTILCDELHDLEATHPDVVFNYRSACYQLQAGTLQLAGPGDSWKPLQAALTTVVHQGSCIRLDPAKDVALA